jgi:ribosome-binding ATPase YchF (GTP1/OBG family)
MYTFNELMKYKSELALKDAGKIRQEGKNYIVQDGEIIFLSLMYKLIRRPITIKSLTCLS